MKEKLLVLIFVLLTVVPGVLFLFLMPADDYSEQEKRTLAPFPALQLSEIEQYPAEFEAFYNDRLPFRNALLSVNRFIDLNVFGVISSQDVALGKDRWLFYKPTMESYSHGSSYDEFTLAKIAAYLEHLDEVCTQNGISFSFLMAPNKSEVYGEYVSNAYTKISDARAYDQLYDYLTTHTDIHVINVNPTLLQNKSGQHLYYKNDTHWNNLGGFVAAQDILHSLDAEYTPVSLTEVTISDTETANGDLADLAGISSFFEKDIQYQVSGYKEDVQVGGDPMVWGDNIRTVSNSGSDKKLLMLCDSFSLAIMPFLSKHYDESYYLFALPGLTNEEYATQESMEDLIAAEQPDVVILQMVERFQTDKFPYIPDTILDG